MQMAVQRRFRKRRITALVDDGGRRGQACQPRQQIEKLRVNLLSRRFSPSRIVFLPTAWHFVWAIWGNEPGKHRSFRKTACYLLHDRQHTIEPWRRPRAISRKEELHIHADVDGPFSETQFLFPF